MATHSPPLILYFSNPDVLYDGVPTGVPVEESTSAHNALSINNTAYNVANFRPKYDCNGNGVCDNLDIANCDGSPWCIDCTGNGVLDECEVDCNGNDIADSCDLDSGTSYDCNDNYLPDECDPDCNEDDTPDECEISDGTSFDCNSNLVPDTCDIANGTSQDVDPVDGLPDECAVCYVRQGGQTLENGLSWDTAFASLQDALSAARATWGGL